MRIKMLNDDAEEPDNTSGIVGYEYLKDLKRYEEKVNKEFHEARA